MPIAPARRVAFDVIRQVESGRSDLGRGLASSRTRLADDRDRALSADLVIGTFRWRARLDAAIARHASRPLPRLDPEVLRVLRLGAFQLLYLDRVPVRAVVDDAVEQTRAAGRSSAAGLVNAVLRRIARDGRSAALPRRPEEPPAHARGAWADYLATVGSHPRWLVERWIDRWGLDATEAWLAFNNAPAPLTLRANRLVVTRAELARQLGAAGVETRPTALAPDGLIVVGGRLWRSAYADSGTFVAQDEGSQLVAEAVAARRGDVVLDTCAAPGGKTLALAASTPEGRVVACDARAGRVALLARMLRTHHAAHVPVVRADLSARPPFLQVFDAVLVDAPCSGLGTLRRDPDLKWRYSESALRALADRQVQLLTNAAAVVRPGGRLVYATCSSEPDENEDVVGRFLDADPRFTLVPGSAVAASLPAGLGHLVEPAGWFRTTPARDQLEAFFAAVMVRDR